MTIYSASKKNKKYISKEYFKKIIQKIELNGEVMETCRKLYKEAYQRIKGSTLAQAFLLNGVFLLCAVLFCDIKYEVSDDYMVDAILSGAYGQGYNAHLLFSNIFLGYALKIMYMLIPVISWYFVFQIVVCYLSLTAATYVILEHNAKPVGILISFILVTFFSDDVYILPQFTKAAALAICAGGVLFLYGLWECSGKKKKITLLLGGGLLLCGSLIRSSCLYVAIGFLVALFGKYVWDGCRKYDWNIIKKNKWHLMATRRLLYCVLVIMVMFLLSAISDVIWQQHPDYADYQAYSTLRSSVTDMNSYGYDSVAEEFEEIGLDLIDYQMINSWNFMEESQYSEEILEKVAQIKKDCHKEKLSQPWGIWKALEEREYWSYMPVIGIVLLLFCGCLLKKKKPWFGFTQLLIVLIYLVYFAYRGRQVYRVEYGIFVSAAICIATTLRCGKVNNTMRRIITYFVVLLGICKIPLYLPDFNYKAMEENEYISYMVDVLKGSGDYDVRKYGIDVYSNPAFGELIALMENDKEHYYLVDFQSGVQLLYYSYKPWIRIEKGYFQNYSYLGGVDTRHPAKKYTWSLKGLNEEEPYKDLVKDSVYVVDIKYYNTKLNYLKENYYPNARIEAVANIDGFYIWKYYAQ